MKLTLKIILLLLGACVFTSAHFRTTALRANQTRPQRKLQLKPCSLPNDSGQALCGQYEVFENRATQAGRKIKLNLVVLPALAAQPAPDPVFFLSGGPGQGAADSARSGIGSLARQLRRERDLVLVDQRGTGQSQQLDCNLYGADQEVQSYFNDLFPVDKVRACRQELEKRADLKLYTTPVAMDDIDEVRAALGYAQINLYGASYGTLAALQYLRQHPAQVRSLALAGVATPETKMPLHFARGAQAAMDKLIADCASDETCHAAFPQFKTEFAAVLARLDKGPVSFELPHPVSKTLQGVSLSRGVFLERLRLMLYNSTASLAPLLIHRAAQGDFAPFGAVALARTRSSAERLAMGMYLTVTCSEWAGAITEEEIEHETSGAFLGDYRTRRHVRACQEWPRGSIPAGYYQPVKSAVPVLMLSGELDPATPARFGAAAAQSLPNSRQVLIRNEAHSYSSDCLRNLIAEFIAKGSAKSLDTACVELARRPRFATELPDRYK
ncbi:MAG TPA: alpha/beta fold hydrolase [Blastocatellia bacterium]|nr:alpha/beta fold hydrolase [Blastocatellia bacterium]